MRGSLPDSHHSPIKFVPIPLSKNKENEQHVSPYQASKRQISQKPVKSRSQSRKGGDSAIRKTAKPSPARPIQNSAMSTMHFQSANSTIKKAAAQQESAEVEKWKKFGYLMAESYDELKQETEALKAERETDRKIVIALRDQIDKLKQIIAAKESETYNDESLRAL